MHLATCEFKYACYSRIKISNNTYKIHCLLFLFPSQDLLTAIRKSEELCLMCLVSIFVGHINGKVFRTGWWAKCLDVTEGEDDGRIFTIIIIIIIIIITSCWYLKKEIRFKVFKSLQILMGQKFGAMTVFAVTVCTVLCHWRHTVSLETYTLSLETQAVSLETLSLEALSLDTLSLETHADTLW